MLASTFLLHLVASFRSTLEEARHADLLIHVVDAADPEAEAQIDTVNRVLEEIGVNSANSLIVLNKMDRVKDRGIVDVLRRRFDDSVSISAATGQGLDRLAEAVAARLANGYADVEIETGAGNGRLFAYLAERAEIKSREYFDSRVKLVCRMPKVIAERLNEDGTIVTLQNGSPNAQQTKRSGKTAIRPATSQSRHDRRGRFQLRSSTKGIPCAASQALARLPSWCSRKGNHLCAMPRRKRAFSKLSNGWALDKAVSSRRRLLGSATVSQKRFATSSSSTSTTMVR